MVEASKVNLTVLLPSILLRLKNLEFLILKKKHTHSKETEKQSQIRISPLHAHLFEKLPKCDSEKVKKAKRTRD